MTGPFQEANGDVSMRRIMAAFFAIVSVILAVIAFPYSQYGWFVFIPSGLSLLAVIFFLFFTTWSDIVAIIKAANKD